MDGPRDLASYLQEFSDRRMPVPPSARRSPERERRRIGDYLATLGVEDLELFAELAVDHPPMSPSTRLVALVPARFEERRIGGFLAAFERETRDLAARCPQAVELIVLVNRRHGEAVDATAAVVRERARRICGVHVLVVERQWSADEARFPLARARKLLADYALYRAYRRSTVAGPLYLLSEDADVEWVEPGRSLRMIGLLDSRPRLDALRGVQERTPAALSANDLVLFERRSWFFTEALLSRRALRPEAWSGANFYWNRVVTGGWNTCFTAEVYALIGGYSPRVRIFEDMDLGQRISVLRGRWRGGRFIPEVGTVRRMPARAVSSAARAILALADRKHIYTADGDGASFFDRAGERVVREASLDLLLARIGSFARVDRRNLARFEAVATDLRAEIHRILGDVDRADALLRSALELTGLPAPTWRISPDGGVEWNDPRPFRRLAAAFSAPQAAAERAAGRPAEVPVGR